MSERIYRTDIEPVDGDIFFWRWRDEDFEKNQYWCKSQIASFHSGHLFDTYWIGGLTGNRSDSVIPLDRVKLHYVANLSDLEKIRDDLRWYYAAESVVYLNHPNSPRGNVYIRSGAKRCPQAMLEYAREQQEGSRSDIRSAEHRLKMLDESIAKIKKGDLDNVWI
jgi:hypothetical protein